MLPDKITDIPGCVLLYSGEIALKDGSRPRSWVNPSSGATLLVREIEGRRHVTFSTRKKLPSWEIVLGIARTCFDKCDLRLDEVVFDKGIYTLHFWERQ